MKQENNTRIFKSLRKAKSGTCSFYAYATLYVLAQGKRVTLAIRGVRWSDTTVAIITYLLAELSELKIRVKKLYLHRGFFGVAFGVAEKKYELYLLENQNPCTD